MPNNNGFFPLKLVDFEEYMLVDDMADYPMVIRCELEIAGKIDRHLLEQALNATAQDNPLLHAFVQPDGDKLNWVDGPHPVIEWTSDFPEMIRMNLKKEIGLLIFADDSNEVCKVRFFIHHSIADGSGINHFVACWFSNYKTLCEGKPLHTTDEDSMETKRCLNNRGRFGMNFFKYLLRPFQEFCGAIGVLEYFSHRPVALGPQATSISDQPSSEEPLSHQFLAVSFDENETRQVIKQAKKLKYKLNDLMLAAMYDACYQWLDKKMPDESDRHIRIMIPMDMRSRKKPERFVGNMVSMIFLDRRPGRYKSLQSLSWYVWLEMAAVKTMKLGLTFVHLIRYFGRRKRLRDLLRRDRSVATTILSNMGIAFAQSPLIDKNEQILDADVIKLLDYRIYPPIRPYTWLTSIIYTYRKSIRLHATWCNQSLTSEDAEQITETFKANLLNGFLPASD